MANSLETYAARCHDILVADPGPAGRAGVCAVIKEMLADADFIAAHVRADGPERKIIYEDPELGFCILAHSYQGAKSSPPHDHGSTWAIYGQATGTTIMTDWEKVEQATAEKPGLARWVRDYELTPGMAYLYEPGDLHSPRRDASTTLIRVEGVDVTKIGRFAYKPLAEAAA
jgi:hypothetical protein